MAVLLGLTLGQSCKSSSEPGDLSPPTELQATALGVNAIAVTWKPAAGVTSYTLERRTDFVGPFEVIKDAIRGDGAALVSYLDTSVEPEHYYGYRVRAVAALGVRSDVSTVAGARTAPVPGVRIRTSTSFASPASADADGFLVSVRGPRDTSSFAVAINGERLIAPLPKGTYTVVLRGLAINCSPRTLGDTVKVVQVSDEGLNTIGNAEFNVSCRDPKKASIVTTVRATGDTVDADGVVITVSGIIREAGTPANERVYFQSRTLQGATPAARFDDLRLGDYEITISDVEAPCVLDGERLRTLQPKALAVDTVAFALTCLKPVAPVDTAGRPLVLRQVWSAASARPGDKVSLLTSLDLRARPALLAAGVTGTIRFDNTVVRFDSARTTRAFQVTANNLAQPGILAFAAAQTDDPALPGNIDILRSWYTVIGAVGATVTTNTTITDVISSTQTKLTSQTRAAEGTLTVSNTTTSPNQAPTAVITGPTAGAVGASLSFSGSQSSDPDGSIASYAWNFGDGQSGTGATVTKSYSTAGTYTVRLTVTDAQGATGTKDQQVVITASAPTTGSVAGTVTSSLGGGLGGVTITVTGGLTATTAANGSYSVANVALGSRTVSVSGVPSNCTAPAAQTVTVAAGASSTANFTVTCTTTGGGATTGTLNGRVTRVSDGSGIGFARITITPAGGSALTPVNTAVDGNYAASGVPIGSGSNAGSGSITVDNLPNGCTIPAAQPYSGLTANGTVTVSVAVTCAVATTGTLTGRITRSTGGDAAGVSVTVTPTGVSALPAVTTNSTGTYTVTNVPAGGGALALASLPTGCTPPASLTYSGLTAGGSLTRDLVLNCVAGPHTYPVTATWGAVTTGGPTGRQVTLTIAVDMGSAPGRPDVAGNAADPMAAITLAVAYDSTKLAYQSRTLLSPNEFDLGIAGTVADTIPANAGQKITTVAVASSAGVVKTGSFQLVRVLMNIRTVGAGTVTPTLTVRQMLADTFAAPQKNVTSSVVVQPIPTLTIPP